MADPFSMRMHFINFLWHWCDKTAGGLAVLVFLAGRVFPHHFGLTTTAFLALLLCAVIQGIKLGRLEERLKGKLKLSCDTRNTAMGCVRHAPVNYGDRGSSRSSTFFEAVVSVVGGFSVENCSAYVLGITREGQELLRPNTLNLILPLGADGQEHVRVISQGVPQLVDILCIDEIMGIRVPVRTHSSGVSMSAIFDRAGDYLIEIAVRGDGVPTELATLELRWRGEAEASSLLRIG